MRAHGSMDGYPVWRGTNRDGGGGDVKIAQSLSGDQGRDKNSTAVESG